MSPSGGPAVGDAAFNAQHFILILPAGKGKEAEVCLLIIADKQSSGKGLEGKNRIRVVKHHQINIVILNCILAEPYYFCQQISRRCIGKIESDIYVCAFLDKPAIL
jgi:hypothetical protein